MKLITNSKESCQKQENVKPTLRIFGVVNEEENMQPLHALTNEKAVTLVLRWLAWHEKEGEQLELRLVEPKEQAVYVIGLLLRKNAICVKYVRNTPELFNKILHHWYYTITYPTLVVQDIKNSVGNADILDMVNTVCNVNEKVSDSELELRD